MTTLLQPNLFDHVDGPPGALVVQRVNHETIKQPCLRWHYARAVPSNAQHAYGVWETGQFRGVIVFGAPVGRRAHTFVDGLDHGQVKELLRIAMNGHNLPLTQIVSMAVGHLRRDTPDTELLISYADPNAGHHGGIYQAASWVYVGTAGKPKYCIIHGQRMHSRSVVHKYGSWAYDFLRREIDPNAQIVDELLKHKYAFGLNRRTRKQLATMALPYPKG